MSRVHPYESKTNEELFQLAFLEDSELDDDYEAASAWAAIRFLRDRNTPDVFERAKECCASPTARHRERGLQVLAELGGEEHPHLDESVELAIRGIRDVNESVVEAAAWALAHFDGQRSKDALMTLTDHRSPEVRHAVAFGLPGASATGSIPVLLRLMEDPDETVRDWATASLGMGPEHDSEEIRQSFRRRLSDSHEETRLEALWGLALRKDAQGLKMLLSRLENDTWTAGDEQTACEILRLFSSDKHPTEHLCEGLRALLPR